MQGVGLIQQEKFHKIRKDFAHNVPSKIVNRSDELRGLAYDSRDDPKIVRLASPVRIFLRDSGESYLKRDLSLPACG